MKPVIIDMKDMSDSAEIYESRPNHFILYFIYFILFIVITIIVWMAVFDMDVVVKGDGSFRGDVSAYEVASDVTGKLVKSYIEDGQYVEEGTPLYTLEMSGLSDNIKNSQEEVAEIESRIAILSAYKAYLDGDEGAIDACADNPFYAEIENRKRLLLANIDAKTVVSSEQIELYRSNVSLLEDSISQYTQKIEQFRILKECIVNKTNTFGTDNTYYYTLVNSYLSDYLNTEKKYDKLISECFESGDESKAAELKDEKQQRLVDLELEQLAGIEQQIENYSSALASCNVNLSSAKLQLLSYTDSGADISRNIAFLTEKNSVESQISAYKEKKEECERYLKSFDIQNDNCTVKAPVSGYYYSEQSVSSGAYVREGSCIGRIYPEKQEKFNAMVYVENSEIGNIKVGQDVKLEIAAYPSSEYGFFSGKIKHVAKDISVNESTGQTYYLVTIEPENQQFIGKNGKELRLMNGMVCRAKIITGRKKVMNYLLEKLNLKNA